MKSNRITSAGHSSNTIVSRSQFKPILFSTDMVNAIIAGKKTQTRRLLPEWCTEFSCVGIVRDPELCDQKAAEWNEIKPKQCYGLYACFDKGEEHFKCKYDVGNILWVRETWRKNDVPTGFPYHHYADDTIYTDRDNEKWKPSIFMPKEACRLFLEVTDIRAERLQDITEEDAIQEGIELIDDGNSYGYKLYGDHSICDMLGRKALTGTEIESYQTLWQKINGVESWEINPYVWVITFKVVECPQGFC